MKSILYLRLIQSLHRCKPAKGFTLIELLVVIVVLGILSAIALPSFLAQASKAKQAEGRTYVGAMNRAQQAYYLENGRFANNLDLLGTGLSSQTKYYDYTIATNSANLNYVINLANPRAGANALKAYYGPTKIGPNESAAIATLTALCESRTPGTVGAAGLNYGAFRLGVEGSPTCDNSIAKSVR
ncbi:MAG: prepilin-type N-terminal cleavage/methylation domain-containing protein [Leptolyngbya sp. SIO4C1]|nr:prepilin-type N-terminal cleavage/methylation domain-containing protein [Leptolyngbya sp. SIO4C1]